MHLVSGCWRPCAIRHRLPYHPARRKEPVAAERRSGGSPCGKDVAVSEPHEYLPAGNLILKVEGLAHITIVP